MSKSNVEIVRAFYDAFNAGDFDRALKYLHLNVELRSGVIAPDSKERYRGRSEVGAYFATIVAGPWDAVTAESREMIEIGDDRVPLP